MQAPPKEAGELVSEWNRCHGAFYQVSEIDLRWNLSEQSLLRYWVSAVEGVPALWAEASFEGAELGIPPKGLWLSLHGEVPEGKEQAFARAVESFARKRESTRIGIGGEEFHFLPGIPAGEERHDRLASAFRDLGFSTADCADFVGAPENSSSEACIRSAIADAKEKRWTLKAAESSVEKSDLSVFLNKEFPGRWSREWEVWNRRRDSGRAFWNLLRDGSGKVLGFSRLAMRGRRTPLDSGWTPGALRLPLANDSRSRLHTDSCLGPIGVGAAERGRGAGRILLGLSLNELSLQGAKLVCIDWTNAYNYYTPLGFQIARRYLSVWKNL